MIAFACSGCGKQYKVKDELAGKKSKCTGCGQPLTVPTPARAAVGARAADDERTLAPRPQPAAPGSGDLPTLAPNQASTPSSPDATRAHGTSDFGASSTPDASLTDFLAPAQAADEIGRLGSYRVLKVLGQGGMGVVFRAEDTGLLRHVALKAMLPSMATAAGAKERFFREARAAAALKHANIVTIYQVGEERGAPYLAMEFLEGEPLDQRLARQSRLPVQEVLRIGKEVAQGLAAAHEKGLIHRDIKPANIWLEGPKAHAKVLDFGLARAMADNTHLTQTGAIIGTPAYMAPEQAGSKGVDHRCDLFSLGCVLYRMCTGEMPFKGEDTISIIAALALETPRPPREINPEVPGRLSKLVMKLLAKKPDERPASALEVAETLHELEEDIDRTEIAQPIRTEIRPSKKKREEAATAVVEAPRKRKRARLKKEGKPWLWVGVATAVAAALVAGVVLLWPTPKGMVRLESDDADVEIVFDRTGPTIRGADKEPITLRAGEHGMQVKRGDFTFETDKLVIKKGETIALKVEVLPGKVQLVHEGKVIGFCDVPIPAPPLAKAPFDKRQAWAAQEAWAKYLGVPVEMTNKRGMKFRLIPPGEFTMGMTPEEAEAYPKLGPYGDAGKRSAPAHSVRITRPFYMAEREVNLAEFLDLMKREPGNVKRHEFNKPELPIVGNCTWLDCIEFCNRLSAEEGLSPAYTVEGKTVRQVAGAGGYRLPTEAEWEFACRAGTRALWYYGMTAAEAARDQKAAVQRHSEHQGNGGPPNPFGLYALYSSSIEWCWDWFSPHYYRECDDRGTVVDPQGPDQGDQRVQRGGALYSDGGNDLTASNSAARWICAPESVSGYNGFGRVVLSIADRSGAAVPAERPVTAPADWAREVAALPPEGQVKAVADRLKEVNPGFDGKVEHKIKDGVVTELSLSADNIKDLSPLRALAGLRWLTCSGSGIGRGQLADLSPLKELKLERLFFANTQVTDLSPLKGMPLSMVHCAAHGGATSVTDLSPLAGTPLTHLFLTGCKVSDLSPLKGRPLGVLDCSYTSVSDLSPLRDSPLTWLKCRHTPVRDLSPLKGKQLGVLHCESTKVTDLSVLRGMPLRELVCDFRPQRDSEVLRSLKDLGSINGKPAADFWKEVDAGPKKP